MVLAIIDNKPSIRIIVGYLLGMLSKVNMMATIPAVPIVAILINLGMTNDMLYKCAVNSIVSINITAEHMIKTNTKYFILLP